MICTVFLGVGNETVSICETMTYFPDDMYCILGHWQRGAGGGGAGAPPGFSYMVQV